MHRQKTETKTVHTKVTASSGAEPASPQAGLIIGRLTGFDAQGLPLIAYDFATLHEPVSAISVTPLDESLVGREVAISFAANRDGAAVIMGVIQQPAEQLPRALTLEDSSCRTDDGEHPVLEIDGQRLQLTGEKEITLKCGKSSITLTQSGKILIKGEHILSRASGSNRILGGAIQLN